MLYQVEYKESVQVDGTYLVKQSGNNQKILQLNNYPLLKEMYGKMILETNTLIQIARMFGQHQQVLKDGVLPETPT